MPKGKGKMNKTVSGMDKPKVGKGKGGGSKMGPMTMTVGGNDIPKG